MLKYFLIFDIQYTLVRSPAPIRQPAALLHDTPSPADQIHFKATSHGFRFTSSKSQIPNFKYQIPFQILVTVPKLWRAGLSRTPAIARKLQVAGNKSKFGVRQSSIVIRNLNVSCFPLMSCISPIEDTAIAGVNFLERYSLDGL